MIKLKPRLLKNGQRLFSILTNSVKQMMGQIISLLLSVFVIHSYSADLWGDFSTLFLYVSISLMVLGWGNKEFLMREFSKSPNKISETFYLAFNTRLALLFVSLLFTLIWFPIQKSLFLMLWLGTGYIAQSLEVFWIYKRDYVRSIAVELCSFLFLLVLLQFSAHLSIFGIIRFYAYYQAFRASLYVGLYHAELRKFHLRADFLLLWATAPFFLLSFTGFLQSRTDFLLIAYFEKNENVAVYQVISTYFILIHAVGTFILLPYIKNLYRLNLPAIQNIQKQISLVAPLIVFVGLVVLYVILTFVYQFHLDYQYYILGFLITFPPYLYAVKIIRMFRENQQNMVVKTGITAIVINSLVSFALLSLQFGLKGALIGSAVAQIYTTVQYLKFKPAEK